MQGVEKKDNIITVSCNLDFNTTQSLLKLGEELLKGHKQFQICFKKITHVDSSGLALLCEWYKLARRRGIELTFDNTPGRLVKIAELCNLKNILPL